MGSVSTVLERRVQLLEEENKELRTGVCQLVEDVEKTEAEEKYLVEDAISRLSKLYKTKTINDLFVNVLLFFLFQRNRTNE